MSRSHKVFSTVHLHPNAFLARAALLVLLYLGTGHLGLAITYLSPHISLLWLPAGVAVAGLMRYGNRMLGVIYLAAFLQDLSAGLSPATAALVSFGNTLAAFACCMVLRYKEVHPQFLQRKDVVWFTIAAMLGMTMSASIGTLVLGWHGWVENLPLTWSTWWAGDLVGTLLMAPLLLSLSASSVKDLIKRREEIIIFLLIFSTINWFIFMVTERQIDLTFIVVATTIWSALRFGVTGATAIALASSAIAALATASGRGPFTDLQSESSLLVLWAYMFTMTIVALVITALQAESLQAAREIQDALERINKVASRLPGLIMQYRIRADRSVSVPYASDAILGIFEVTQEQVVSDALHVLQKIDSGDVEKGNISLREATRTMSPWQNEFRFRRADGTVRWLMVDALPEREADGAMLWHCFVSDITERKQAEKDLRIAAFTFESQEGIFVTDADWQILRVNHAFSKIAGYDSNELIGQKIRRHYDKQQDKAFYDVLMDYLKEHHFWQGELRNRRKNGEIYPQMITVTAITDSRGDITNYVGSFTDISRHKGYEAEIRNLAFYDPLTQLPNRRLLMDRLQHLISISKRNESHSAILFIDLDNFKTLNDTRGHDAGDILLVETARRLQTCMRECDTVARLGGDEFVVVLEELSHTRNEAIQQTDRIAEKIRQVLSQPYAIMDFEHHGSSSIGACLFQGNDVTVKDLFKRADTAMYEAKTSGRNAVRFFDPAMQAILVVRMMLESNLRLALAQNQFQLYYQVQVNSDGKLIGAEALLRWIHPDRGFISPADFIPLAEETGLIIPIGLWVMETACAQIKLWEAHEDSRHLSLAVNVSAKQFKQADFVEAFTEIVHRHGIDPTRLKIELTESTVLDNVDATTEKMHQLKKLGISFSMDDFGTGYSSLAYLQRLPLNQLKIDQSFVRDLSDDENDATIVRAIISLGVNLGLNVIAEGVETDAQRSFLIEHNCLAFQGYLFSKPLPLDGFLKLLALDSSKNPA